MPRRLLAADYDLTLVGEDARLTDATCAALERLRAAGWALVVVTGRDLDYLLGDLHRPELFDLLVADNGVVLHRPATDERHLLTDLDLEPLRAALVAVGVPAWGGPGTIGLDRRHETVLRGLVAERAVPVHLERNKDSLIVLPEGIDKGSGLAAAAAELGCRIEDTVAVGDAENDVALLRAAGVGAAVGNALPAVRAAADVVLAGEAGAGVVELAERLLSGAHGRPGEP